ncbi:MAG: 30S ribosomal protein S16 [Phycisphaerales bacterium]|nr:MAG: 30S ribosomal protein S16 [Phycisphaerales bacterium]
MVVLRLKRMGRTHRPFYRLCAMDKRVSCDGRAIEELGWYDPLASEEKQVSLKLERIDYWLSVGAQPSDTVRSILKKAGCDPTPGKKVATTKAPAAATPATVPAAAPAEARADKTTE